LIGSPLLFDLRIKTNAMASATPISMAVINPIKQQTEFQYEREE
jgi:hypothetical protein